ncbi:unnamed protein product [Rotaria sp. Silwood1]|nr:unnamed protein product [Rotaria sp. Silwood1]CAF4713114.1 unnamed protein product [Rotaria sp. Silwood1]
MYSNIYSGTIISSDVVNYCIHVTNMPKDVNSEELSMIFKIDITNILVRPYNELNQHLVENNRVQAEAWINEINNECFAQKLATEKNGSFLRGCNIHCEVICFPVKIFELCEYFEKGICRKSIGCENKHIRCVEPLQCENTQCWYGHNPQRRRKSERRSRSNEDGYRVRIGNFPHSATREQIFKRLTINFPKIRENLILCNESNPNEPIIAYVIDQMSEINVKKMIHAWHNQLFSSDQPNRMKCQWEVNVEYFNLTIGFTMPIIQTQSRAPSIISSINSIADHKRNARYNLQKQFSARKTRNDIDHYLSSQSNSNFERVSTVNVIELPSTWDFNNAVLLTERTDEISKVYLITNQEDPNRKAELKVYSSMSDRTSRLRVRRHRIVLEQLKELGGIPKLIHCNHDELEDSLNITTKLWILTETIQGITLAEYFAKKERTFSDIIHIILLLIDLVKEIHNKNIVHRNLTPKNIFIHNSNSIDGVKLHLTLIDFDLAHINEKHLDKTNPNIWSRDNKQMKNDFYEVPQFEVELLNNNDIDYEIQQVDSARQSALIDTTLICALLFWMITLKEPKNSRDLNGKAPHETDQSIKFIEHALEKVANRNSGKFHSLRRHLTLIFDRGFGKSQQQWPINQLEGQILLICELITSMKHQDDSSQMLPTIPIPSSEPLFIRLASFINRVKHSFVHCCTYFDSICWSSNENNRWSGNNQIIDNYDILIIGERRLPIKFQIIRYENIDMLKLNVEIKNDDMTIIELPCGYWKEDDIENQYETITNTFILEFINFYNTFIEE